ncbi:hypothetical protein H0H92_007072 [Tricholoma furcatifolium]|nr:hypothetical protein H0H92_007072 [Tricholoma furcatifolium]
MALNPFSTSSSTTPPTTTTDTTTSTPTLTSTTTSLGLGPGPVTSPSATSSSVSSSVATTSSSVPTSTSTTTTTPTPTTSTTPLLPVTTTSSTPLFPTTSVASVTTSTSIVAVTASTAATPTVSTTHSNKSFFQNTGAVAGVFTVVGLIVVALIIAFCTNIFRRRRQRQFDRETEEAATEAANAPAPTFLDDENDIYGPPVPAGSSAYHDSGGYNDHPNYAYPAENNNGGYSDVSSHGTYSQPPMSHPESYNMRELSPPPQELYGVPYAPSNAGQAGVGVARARSTLLSSRASPGADPSLAFASGLQEGSTPYPAFAGPGAYATGAYGADGVKRGMSLSHSQSPPPQLQPGYNPHEELYNSHSHQQDIARNPSATTYGTSATYVSGAPSPKPYNVEPVHEHSREESVYDGDEGLAYGGYEEDDEQEHTGQRVLKVANE